MLSVHGAGIGAGIFIGSATVFRHDRPEVPEYSLDEGQVEGEVARFRAAVQRARHRLLSLQRSLPLDAPSEIGTFIDAHVLMLDDPLIAEQPVTVIREQRRNAEWALMTQSTLLIDAFDRIEDSYLRSKKLDVEQVVNRVQDELLNSSTDTDDPFEVALDGQVVVTHDLSPADAVLLRNRRMGAFVTNLGSPISHTAILARSLRVPAVLGLHGAIRYIRTGDTLIVDGGRGLVLIEPDAQTVREYRQRQRQQALYHRSLEDLKDTEARTRDGETIALMANIELPEEVQSSLRVGASGIGLYRTEFLFMNRDDPPSEEEQFDTYRRVVEAMRRPVVIRTLDLGADKQVDGGRTSRGAGMNPSLGLRAVRLCLREPNLFRPQLRAILRASAFGPVQIMVPMMSSVSELGQVLEMIAEVKRELHRQREAFDPQVPVGGMIEVPAAAIAADVFADRLDFLSIGTNDLIQYTLAIDRVDDDVSYLYDPLHPSVLRLIHNTIRAGDAAGIPVAMCGEMAGDPDYTRLLLGLGLRVFSMDPDAVPEVKKRVLDAVVGELKSAADKMLVTAEPDQLRDLLERLNRS